MTARLLEQRRETLAGPQRDHPAETRHRRVGRVRRRRLRGWFDRVVPAEGGPVRLRARQPLA